MLKQIKIQRPRAETPYLLGLLSSVSLCQSPSSFWTPFPQSIKEPCSSESSSVMTVFSLKPTSCNPGMLAIYPPFSCHCQSVSVSHFTSYRTHKLKDKSLNLCNSLVLCVHTWKLLRLASLTSKRISTISEVQFDPYRLIFKVTELSQAVGWLGERVSASFLLIGISILDCWLLKQPFKRYYYTF